MDGGRPFQRPRSVHGVDVDRFGAGEGVEQGDRVLASVSGEVAGSGGRSSRGLLPCSGRGRKVTDAAAPPPRAATPRSPTPSTDPTDPTTRRARTDLAPPDTQTA